jgi:hypothetical protein
VIPQHVALYSATLRKRETATRGFPIGCCGLRFSGFEVNLGSETGHIPQHGFPQTPFRTDLAVRNRDVSMTTLTEEAPA